MKRGSLLIPLFTLLLISIPTSTVHTAKSGKHDTRTNISRVTDADITKICPHTTNPKYCKNLINQFMGEPLFPDNVRTIISKAQVYASTTADKFESLYSGVKDDDKSRHDIKMSYHSCWKGYNYASDQLQQAKRSVRDESSRNVKIHTSNAMHQAVSCTEDNANTLRDIGSIVLSICEHFWPKRG